MKKLLVFISSLILVFGIGCEETIEPSTQNTGVLQFGYRMPGQQGFKKTDSTMCRIIDIGPQLQYFGVGKQRLVDSADVNTYVWQILFHYQEPQDTEFSFFADRQDVQLQVDTGVYQSNIVRQGVAVAWMLETPNGDTIIAMDSNVSITREGGGGGCHGELDERFFMTEYLDSTGMFKEEGGKMYRCSHGGTEGLGEFEIRPGKTTQVIMRNNMATVRWIDTDKSGTWTFGDILTDHTTYDGTPLMMRYEVTYLD